MNLYVEIFPFEKLFKDSSNALRICSSCWEEQNKYHLNLRFFKVILTQIASECTQKVLHFYKYLLIIYCVGFMWGPREIRPNQ